MVIGQLVDASVANHIFKDGCALGGDDHFDHRAVWKIREFHLFHLEAQAPEGRELFVDMSVRENLDLGGHHLTPDERATQIDWL